MDGFVDAVCVAQNVLVALIHYGIEPGLELARAVRTITRHHDLRPQDAVEDFYKLALELDVGTSYASTISEDVKKTR